MTTVRQDLYFEDVEQGTEIPTYAISLTKQRLVMEAGANRDFAPMHFDREAAQSSGAPDVFANTMLLQMLFEVTLRQWSGLGGRLRKLAFKMHDFNSVGQTLSCGGVVVAKSIEDGRGIVELDVWQEASRQGTTVTGSAAVELPLRDRETG